MNGPMKAWYNVITKQKAQPTSTQKLSNYITFQLYLRWGDWEVRRTSKRNGEKEGIGVRWVAAGWLRSIESVQGPGGDAGDEGALGEGEVDRNRESQDHQGEAQVVLSRRRRQPSPEVSTPRPTISRLHSWHRLGQGRSPPLPPRSLSHHHLLLLFFLQNALTLRLKIWVFLFFFKTIISYMKWGLGALICR